MAQIELLTPQRRISRQEKDLYEPVKAALDRSFASIGKITVIETAATKGLGESFKALIP